MQIIQLSLPDKLGRVIKSLPIASHDFIIDAIRERLKKIQIENLEKKLIKGYKASGKEIKMMTSEFEFIDLENWDAY